ncbi:hypothetical protein CAL7716_103580 (plasmid) [Calothrix sp. PCC 7716]|nr:hypothetical protein CAL7716_103580 [Calothrix sp. PCC 7716]
MSSYPYIVFPQLLLNFIAENSFEEKKVVSRQKNHGKIQNFLAKQAEKGELIITNAIPKWSILRHILLKLPIGLMSFAAALICTIKGVYGGLPLVIEALVAIMLWISSYIKFRDTPDTIGNHHDVNFSCRSEKKQGLNRLKKLKMVLARKVKEAAGVSNAPLGTSERAFRAIVEQYFPGRVSSQLEFPVSIKGKQYAYSTDIAIILDEVGLSIDIEIDEPYDYKSRRPTHCIDDPADARRNQYFVENNWIVIRFSEAQIVMYPHSCCKTIAKVVSRVTGSQRFLKDLHEIPDLQPYPMWTKKQAKKMAGARTRDSYLPKTVH